MPESVRSLLAVLQAVRDGYAARVPRRLQVVDAYLVTTLLTGALVLAYGAVFSASPFNSFLSGVFVCAGSFVLTVALRMQLNPANRAATAAAKNRWRDMTLARVFVGWALCQLVLQLAAVNFMG